MNDGKICVSIYGDTADEMLGQIRLAETEADLIELRLDYLPAAEIDRLLEDLPKTNRQYLITFRPCAEGGYSKLTKVQRIRFWSYALWKLRDHDVLVDYEGDIDCLLQLAPERTIVSIHDFDNTITDLATQFEVLSQLTGKTIKVAVTASDVVDAIEVWNLLHRPRDKAVIPIAMGEAGKWTRILGLAHGSPITYASLARDRTTAPGQITANDLKNFYRVKELDRETRVYGLIAGETSYSLSPYMHNAAFRQSGSNAVFIPLKVADLDAFIRRMVVASTREVELNFHGFSVTNPHKQSIMKYLDSTDDVARAIGAVNTVKIEDGKLHGYNTDARGFIEPLKNLFGDVTDARVAVVGTGGAARACVYALKSEGANVTVLARDPAKASRFAKELDVSFAHLTTRTGPLPADILVNATPVGTKGDLENETIATADELRGVRLVYDLVYNPSETYLMREAKIAGVRTIGGLEMLIAQGERQFEIWTGKDVPLDAMRGAIAERVK